MDIEQAARRHDVVIVGYGPVGQALAALLGVLGHDVLVVERYTEIYPLPRAVRLDGEVMLLLQHLGVIRDVEHELARPDRYVWFGADGDVILDIPLTESHPSGWGHSYMFHQPTLEAALCARAEREHTVAVERGWTVTGIAETANGDGDDVDVIVTMRATGDEHGESREVRARYLIGCDGANSDVRSAVGITRTDLGFEEPWIVVDARPNDMADFVHLPMASQQCDPRRPTTAVQNGTHLRRWEFMLLPGETAADFDDPARVWELLDGHMRPDQGEIVRYAVYTFRSLVADSLRAGHVLLAGDAAHLMPPFMGEGMCSGFRDVANLAWKLDLVLRYRSPDSLLDTYTTERAPQNLAAIEMSVAMGRVSCVLDPDAAAQRDAAMRSGQLPPPPPLPRLGPGAHMGGADEDAVAGGLAVQGTVSQTRHGDVFTGRTGDVLGPGFVLVIDGAVPDGVAARAAEFDVHLAALGDTVVDVDGELTGWMRANAAAAVLVRPDGYVFGASARPEGAAGLLDALEAEISHPR